MSDPLFAARRLEELFRYFLAASDAAGLSKPNIESVEGYDPSKARISSDPVLNGLCQLGIVRLGCDRGFVSLIDNEHQYIASEMTSVGSLVDNSRHPPGETVCVGASILDLEAGVCAGTMPVFLDAEEPISTANIFANASRYVINDFTKEEKYRERPYVNCYPHMRYYAEVPIKSALGYVIGTYAVVDNKPRDGISDEHYLVLEDIATAIMRHLETLKVESDHHRALKLVHGLDSFVNTDETRPRRKREHTVSQDASSSGGVDFVPTQGFASFNAQTPKEEESRAIYDLAPTPTISRPETITSKSAKRGPAVVNDQCDSFANDGTSGPTEGLSEIKDRFSRAANILQESMDLDGVVFLDASFSNYGSDYDLDWMSAAVNESGTDISLLSRKSPASLSVHGRLTDPAADTLVPCLGSSIKSLTATNSLYSLPPTLHQSMIRNFPTGRVFILDESMSTTRINLKLCDEPAMNDRSTTKATLRQKYARLAALEDALRFYLPGAQSVVFHPLWDPYKSIWSTGGIGWSKSRKRLLTKEDHSYFSVFGNSTMMEVARLELAATDRARFDFISLISHELRSPLHGILGCAELLRETEPNIGQHEMIRMIESCGQTLLQTLDQVLDYSKINSRKEYQDLQTSKASKQQSRVVSSDRTTGVHLTAFTEDLVKGLVTGNQYRMSRHSSTTPASQTWSTQSVNAPKELVTVMVELEKTADVIAEIDSASWHRIILNTVGNALKYTTKGHILVRLNVADVDDAKQDLQMATFSVHDTGCGISNTYLRDHIFTPFVQEDSLSDGTGLGLSIVKKLVDSEGGFVRISSERGKGTDVVISLPFRRRSMTPANSAPHYSERQVSVLDLIGHRTSSDLLIPSSTSLVDSISGTLETWYGFRPTRMSRMGWTAADIVVVNEADACHARERDDFDASGGITGHCIFLILCTEHGMLNRQGHSISERVIYLAAPYGPHHIGAALQTALDQDLSTDATLTIITDPTSEALFKVSQSSDSKSPTSLRSQASSEVYASAPSRITNPAPALRSLQTTEPPGAPTASDRRKLFVLLVDDNPLNLKILERCVQSLDCHYDCAVNGQEAVAKFRTANAPINGTPTQPYTHVFMDISMPVMNGFEATRAIREIERSSLARVGATSPSSMWFSEPCQIIAMTGLGSDDAQADALRSGMDKFLKKPVQIRTIRAQLEDRS